MLGSGQEILFGVHFIGDSRFVAKFSGPSFYPGPWARMVLHTGMGMVATVTIEKWQETKELILELGALVWEGRLPWKRLERIRGFLI